MTKNITPVMTALALICQPSVSTSCTPLDQFRNRLYPVLNKSLIADIALCPGPEDPPEFTKCCANLECCTSLTYQLQVKERQLVMIVSLSVMIACLALAAILIICCFWNKCLLYNTCRPNYNSSDVIVYTSPDDELMPKENRCGYLTTKVKIRQMNEL